MMKSIAEIRASVLPAFVIILHLVMFEGVTQAADLYTVTELKGLPERSSNVRRIDFNGNILGSIGNPDGSGTTAVLWENSKAGSRRLGTLPGGDFSQATAINVSGQVVGFSNTSTSMRAFIWSANS